MSDFHFIQMPPDGTGKRSSQEAAIEIKYSGGTIDFALGDTVTTDSGVDGVVVKLSGTTSSGEIYLRLNHGSATNAIVSEAIKVDGITYAQVSSATEDFYTQEVVITGGNNPFNSVSVNEQGAMTTTWTSGDPLFDAFGKLQTSESTTIREYQPVTDELPDEFTDTVNGTGVINYDITRHVIELTTGTDNGAYARRRSNLYHKYQTGVSTTVMFSAFLGDSGKAGVIRRIGLYDDEDGVFFHADEDNPNGLGVVVRSSVSGSVVETHVHQNAWNIDRLDGTGDSFNLSRKTLDPTKIQVMFIDFQWLGGGRVRFGFVIDGQYIVCHEFNHANNISNPYMRTGSLPLSYEQENVAGTASPSSMYIVSSSVKCEGKFTPREHLQGGISEPSENFTDETQYEQLLSIRAAQTLSGHDNRAIAVPQFIHITEISGSSDPYQVELVKNDTLGGTVVWLDPYPNNALESTNPTAGGVTSTTGGEVLLTEVGVGKLTIDMTKLFGLQSQLMIRKADITATPDHFTVRIKPATASGDVTLIAGMTWKEYR